MSLTYQLRPIEGLSQEGVVSRIFIRDTHTLLTIKEDHAPLMMILSKGFVDLFLIDESCKHFEFEQGLLCYQDNNCSITLLK